MARRRQKSRKIKPTYFVFCEGETEVEYLNILRQHFRVPIEIKPKLEGNKITNKKVKSFLKGKQTTRKDKIFLLYDLDAPKILEKLQKIDNANLLVSNPCIEFWFILHEIEHNSHIKTDECIKKIESIWTNYKKNKLTNDCVNSLRNNYEEAIMRAKNFKKFENPSSTIHVFIEELKKLKS